MQEMEAERERERYGVATEADDCDFCVTHPHRRRAREGMEEEKVHRAYGAQTGVRKEAVAQRLQKHDPKGCGEERRR